MKQEKFCSIGLPRYFDFQPLLDTLRQKDLSLIYGKIKEAGKLQDVNYHFFQNKDGRFSWRPMQIIHPAIYVCLVETITKKNNWKVIVERFKEFAKDDHILCCSLPKINHSAQTDTADTVLNWWNSIEQQTIQLSMHYNYLMITDISDCYSSFYTHSITWAMCNIENAKKILQDGNKGLPELVKKQYHIGDTIDKQIRAMSYQQTNGIPQGSVLMDFIAELVLGYADYELSRALLSLQPKSAKPLDYKILRYRDDYRIFGKTQEDVIQIAKVLSEVLSKLNLRLNTQKTMITQDLICDAIKSDKLYYITHDYKQLEEPESSITLQKHLLRLYKLSQEHPNSGSLQKAMSAFFKRICNWKRLDLFKEVGEADVLISILTNIAYNNPRIYREYVGIVSKILSYEPNDERKGKIIQMILEKFHLLPNVGFLEIWLQRLTIKDERRKAYSEDICNLAAGQKTCIWNIDWLGEDIKDIFNTTEVINEKEIERLPDVIEYKEIERFYIRERYF